MISLFARYATVGVLNTGVHWAVFLVLFYIFEREQSLSNLGAFCVAVTFSFVCNAKYTFRQKATSGRYIAYVAFMGAVSAIVGAVSDSLKINPLITLVVFSAISLVLGFLYSRFFVFPEVK